MKAAAREWISAEGKKKRRNWEKQTAEIHGRSSCLNVWKLNKIEEAKTVDTLTGLKSTFSSSTKSAENIKLMSENWSQINVSDTYSKCFTRHPFSVKVLLLYLKLLHLPDTTYLLPTPGIKMASSTARRTGLTLSHLMICHSQVTSSVTEKQN